MLPQTLLRLAEAFSMSTLPKLLCDTSIKDYRRGSVSLMLGGVITIVGEGNSMVVTMNMLHLFTCLTN